MSNLTITRGGSPDRSTRAPKRRTLPLATRAARLGKACAIGLRGLWQQWLTGLRCRRDVETFGELDAATLRDLGMSRCEVESVRMEADGRITRTRLRLINKPLAH